MLSRPRRMDWIVIINPPLNELQRLEALEVATLKQADLARQYLGWHETSRTTDKVYHLSTSPVASRKPKRSGIDLNGQELT